MELLALIFFLWLIGCAFPGSGHSYGPDFGEVLAFIVCAALVVAYFVGLTALSIAVAEWSGNGWLGLVTWIAIFFGTLTANKLIVDAHVRNSLATASRGEGK